MEGMILSNRELNFVTLDSDSFVTFPSYQAYPLTCITSMTGANIFVSVVYCALSAKSHGAFHRPGFHVDASHYLQ